MSATVSNADLGVSIERPALYVVATPIGNLGDISQRAVAVLRQVDVIYAEDTRTSGKLMQHYAIQTPLQALHEHNERARSAEIVEATIAERRAVALISDAGTPAISDPGYHLVNAAFERRLQVHSIPGPCAAVAALAVSGLASDQFVFFGFLSAKTAARDKQLEQLRHESRTMIFYEAPHRIMATLTAMGAAFGESREVMVARELTKHYETLYRGTIAEVLGTGRSDAHFQRGEIVIVVAGASDAGRAEQEAAAERVLAILLTRLPKSEAVKTASEITGMSKNRLYRLCHE